MKRRHVFLLLMAALFVTCPSPAPASAANPRARFTLARRSFDRIARCSIGASPWSPVANVLALSTSDGLALLDMDATPPRTQLLIRIERAVRVTIAWSNDGRRIACAMHPLEFPIPAGGEADSLIVVDVQTARRTLVCTDEIWPFLWGSDGALYGWAMDPRQEKPLRLLPPDPRGATSRLHASTLIARGTRPLLRFIPGDPPAATPVDGFGDVLQRTGFPDGKRFLVTRYGGSFPDRNIVLDSLGRVIQRLDGLLRDPVTGRSLRFFSAHSATYDGRYVAGESEIDSPHGEDIERAPVFLIASDGSLRLPLQGAPDALEVECARAGPWLALQALKGGELQIGRWSVTR